MTSFVATVGAGYGCCCLPSCSFVGFVGSCLSGLIGWAFLVGGRAAAVAVGFAGCSPAIAGLGPTALLLVTAKTVVLSALTLDDS